MSTTKMIRIAVTASLVAAFAAIGGCHSSSNDDSGNTSSNNTGDGTTPTNPVITVPNSVDATSASFVAYIKTLAIDDERQDPAAIDVAFKSPDEDTGEPQALP